MLHQQASDWFATVGQIGEAIQHALSGGNPDRAVQLLEAHVHELLDREDLLLLEACLRALPAELVYRRPGLLLARCWALQVRAAYLSLPPLLQRVKQLLTEESTSAGADRTVWQTDLDALLAVVSFLRVELEPARERGWRALQNLSPTFRLGRRNAAAAWAVAEQLLGNGETAVAWLKSESDAHLDEPDGHGLQMAGVLGLLHLIR
jgi:ATP/maltotriose-dependent transcriptional regulator MalT